MIKYDKKKIRTNFFSLNLLYRNKIELQQSDGKGEIISFHDNACAILRLKNAKVQALLKEQKYAGQYDITMLSHFPLFYSFPINYFLFTELEKQLPVHVTRTFQTKVVKKAGYNVGFHALKVNPARNSEMFGVKDDSFLLEVSEGELSSVYVYIRKTSFFLLL